MRGMVGSELQSGVTKQAFTEDVALEHLRKDELEFSRKIIGEAHSRERD